MTALARPSIRRLPLAAALTGGVALAVSLLLGPGASSPAPITLGAIASVLMLTDLVSRTRQLLQHGLGFHVGLALLSAGVIAAAWSVLVAAHLEYCGLAFALGLGGTVLLTLALLRLAEEAKQGQTPWQALAVGGPAEAFDARTRFQRLGPLLAGVLAVLVALRLLALGISGSIGSSTSGAAVLTVSLLVVVVAGPAAAIRRVRRARRVGGEADRAQSRDEQVVAAHLHDSVLQTLSLIQRSADDPSRMAQLARQQERSLRDWLAGRDEPAASSLSGALRLMARTVEDEEPGAVVELLTVGDAPLDPAGEAMVHAAREAMRNAVRHAGGAVEVFLEVEADGARQLFVRDQGAGFALDLVADERRGIRDAIVRRMQHVGGSATIESGPTGTDVSLVLPPLHEATAR